MFRMPSRDMNIPAGQVGSVCLNYVRCSLFALASVSCLTVYYTAAQHATVAAAEVTGVAYCLVAAAHQQSKQRRTTNKSGNLIRSARRRLGRDTRRTDQETGSINLAAKTTMFISRGLVCVGGLLVTSEWRR